MASEGAKKFRYEFSVDRGGTFTDIFCAVYDLDGTLVRVDRSKLLSEDSHYDDPISEGIRRLLSKNTGKEVSFPLPVSDIAAVRIGTTIGTNALLERKGARTALLMTKGFKDLLLIGNQSRPKIFDLDIKKFDCLAEVIEEVDERIEVLSHQEKSSVAEDAVSHQIVKAVNEEKVRQVLRDLKKRGIESIAVSLMHSYATAEHEVTVGRLAKEEGFSAVFLSHESSNKIGYLARSSTCLLDAYLFPIIHKYFQRILAKFEDSGKNLPVFIMQSDGAITPLSEFSGSKSILSGPAGGVSGFSKTTTLGGKKSHKLIGFDMGGTSTDVSTFEGNYEMNYESEIAGTFVSTPHLDINTVAAGGGSCLSFNHGLFRVGPESAGSNPGPVCYGKNGLLAVTDLNLILGRIQAEYFPRIFGKNQDQPLDLAQSQAKFAELVEVIKKAEPRFKDSTIEEIAYGFIQVANEVMCRPIRALTESRGKDPKHFQLAIFGGAGAQHACAVAKTLSIKSVFVHRYSSILSAYGIFLADITKEGSLYFNKPLNQLHASELEKMIAEKGAELKKSLPSGLGKGYKQDQESSFVLRFGGSESVLTIRHTEGKLSLQELESEFKRQHLETFGFLLETRPVVLLSIYVQAKLVREEVGDIISAREESATVQKTSTAVDSNKTIKVFFSDPSTGKVKPVETPLYKEDELPEGWNQQGPAIVSMNGSSIVVEPGWKINLTKERNFELEDCSANLKASMQPTDKDPILLSIFGQRFMSIAEQMGRRLQRTALSTNIKERLDFSCAIFGPDGCLVANAPHLPVHLGSMESTVTYQIQTLGKDLKDGDVVISNHPKAGGSHLPDITAITPCYFQNKPIFFVASRGHHSDIGGKTPGSMPAFAQNITEEGVAFKSFKIVESGVFQEESLHSILTNPPDGIVPSRNVEENISDLKAQVASNRRGVELLLKLVEEYSLEVVHSYMNYIQEAAEESVRAMLVEISKRNGMKEIDTVSQEDFMDDGSSIALKLEINRVDRTAKFDFTESGLEVLGNFNTPDSVVRSAIIYCLRCLVSSDIPLNAGCLRPVKILTKEGSILNPSETAAIVGGNVTTSQRITDVILKAFKAMGDSQGCMNNFTFGDSSFGYYETIAGGSGAGPTWDGVDAVQSHMTNTRITDPEIFESRFPAVLQEFSIRKDSGGDGQHRGGNGAVRQFRFKKPVMVSVLSERRVFSPQGILGGQDGKRGVNTMIYPSGRAVNVGGKCSIEVEAGTVFRICTPGGGGYGCAKDRKEDKSGSNAAKTSLVEAGSLHSYAKMQEQA